jgi:ATP-binding cassette, subfamily B (MDR/TAP), member 1
VFGAWMMGQALAFAPNFGAAISAAGRVMTQLARKPKVESTASPAVPENFVSTRFDLKFSELTFLKQQL